MENKIFDDSTLSLPISETLEIDIAIAQRIGLDGVSVIETSIDDEGCLITTLSDGRKINAGRVASDSKYAAYQDVVRFKVSVNCQIADNDSNSSALADGQNIYDDFGALMLPTSYSPSGSPTPLVIYCHGSSKTVSENGSEAEERGICKYLVVNGFAVMDMAGIPAQFAASIGVSVTENFGSPIAVKSYLKGYKWVAERYNIAPEGVYLLSSGSGGLAAANFAQSRIVNVISQAMISPILDTYNQLWLNPWGSNQTKTWFATLYKFASTTSYDAAKVVGFNPILNGLISADGKDYKKYPCPLKIWHSESDFSCDIASSIKQVNSIKNSGGWAELRRFASGGYDRDTLGVKLSSPLENSSYLGSEIAVYTAMEEILLWFKGFA